MSPALCLEAGVVFKAPISRGAGCAETRFRRLAGRTQAPGRYKCATAHPSSELPITLLPLSLSSLKPFLGQAFSLFTSSLPPMSSNAQLHPFAAQLKSGPLALPSLSVRIPETETRAFALHDEDYNHRALSAQSSQAPTTGVSSNASSFGGSTCSPMVATCQISC